MQNFRTGTIYVSFILCPTLRCTYLTSPGVFVLYQFYCPRKRRQYCFRHCRSVNTITREPHLAWWNFARRSTLTNSTSLLNIKAIGQRSRSHVLRLWVTRQATRSRETIYVCDKLQTHSLGGASGGCVPVTKSWPGFTKCCTVFGGVILSHFECLRTWLLHFPAV